MNHPPSALRRIVRLAAPLVLAGSLSAQTTTTPAATQATAKPATPAPPSIPSLELPRLKSKGPSDLPRLGKNKVTVDDLLPQGLAGAKTATKQNINYLALDPGKDWSRPLRGSPNAVSFVSFLVYGSDGTTIDLGAAKLTIKPSARPGYAKILLGTPPAVGAPARELGDLVKIETHGTAALAALPVITVRLDPAKGVWDLYFFQRLMAEDLPLADLKGSDKKFALHAGAQGAWLCSLVDSDDNPLFIDANHNGIDDKFEKAQPGGALLPATATAAQRTQLAQVWKASQKAANVPPWRIRRPVPDAVLATAPPK